MEAGIVLIIIIGFFIVNSNLNSKFKSLERTIDTLNDRIRYLQEKIAQQTNALKGKSDVVYEKEIPKDPIITKPEVVEEPITPIYEEKTIDVTTPVIDEVPLDISLSQHEDKPIEEPTENPIAEEQVYVPQKTWLEKFKEKNPDLEKFIGENLINKIGILILVLGISFFVKYAIDKDWINEPARVGVGILSGALVMGIAHRLKKNYASFSSVLVAGAISIFYFTIYIAFHEYKLFSQTVAFSIMAVITAFSALVSISYNRQELAILSLIGGFAAPFMLSTGSGNYVVLFTYIAILNIGILAMSYFKKWKIVTILAFIFTILLFGGWCITTIGSPKFSHTGALTFATLFYFIFSITIVLNNLKNKGTFSTIEYFILIANTFFFFGVGMLILSNWGSNFTGLFTLMLGVYNIFYAAILYKKFGLDKNAVYLLIGLALTFATLTIPIQFKGNQITLFWALEAVLLFWLSQKSKINSFKLGAVAVQILALISLCMDWKRYFNTTEEFSVLINPLFIAGFMVSLSLFFTYWLLRKEKEDFTIKSFTIPLKNYKNILLIVATFITYTTGILEIDYQPKQFLINEYSAVSFPVVYHFIFITTLLYVSILFKKELIQKISLILGILSIAFYILFFYKLPKSEIIENFVLDTHNTYAFYFHYIILGSLVYIGYLLFKKAPLLFNIQPKQSKWLPWVFIFAVVYIFSNEIMIHGLQFSNSIDIVELADKYPTTDDNIYQKNQFVKDQINTTETQIIKIGYPIFWGIFSFIFLIIGIKRQWKTLRIIALSLLGLTIIKLFLYDIKNVSDTGKIIAFILLGVLILIISFVYQKIKKIVIDEEKNEQNNDSDEEI